MLVVGVGNSGAEIGTQLARAGARVAISIRRGANFVPLTLVGIPKQYYSRWMQSLPGGFGRFSRPPRLPQLSAYGAGLRSLNRGTARQRDRLGSDSIC